MALSPSTARAWPTKSKRWNASSTTMTSNLPSDQHVSAKSDTIFYQHRSTNNRKPTIRKTAPYSGQHVFHNSKSCNQHRSYRLFKWSTNHLTRPHTPKHNPSHRADMAHHRRKRLLRNRTTISRRRLRCSNNSINIRRHLCNSNRNNRITPLSLHTNKAILDSRVMDHLWYSQWLAVSKDLVGTNHLHVCTRVSFLHCLNCFFFSISRESEICCSRKCDSVHFMSLSYIF